MLLPGEGPPCSSPGRPLNAAEDISSENLGIGNSEGACRPPPPPMVMNNTTPEQEKTLELPTDI